MSSLVILHDPVCRVEKHTDRQTNRQTDKHINASEYHTNVTAVDVGYNSRQFIDGATYNECRAFLPGHSP